MPREEGRSRSAAPSLVLLERLVALADRAIEAARAGDMTAVNTLLDEREPFLAQLADALAARATPPIGTAGRPTPAGEWDAAGEAKLAELARHDLETMSLLERGIAEARVNMASELAALTVARATVSGYADGTPPSLPAGMIDIRR
jgi:hypothetical protein